MPDFTIQIMQQCTHYQKDWTYGGYHQSGFCNERIQPYCTCPAFKYSKDKHCKHIDKIFEVMCQYHELIDGPPVKDGTCPKCGRPTEYVKVAV